MGQWKWIRIIRYNTRRVTLGIWRTKRKIDNGVYYLSNSAFLSFVNFLIYIFHILPVTISEPRWRRTLYSPQCQWALEWQQMFYRTEIHLWTNSPSMNEYNWCYHMISTLVDNVKDQFHSIIIKPLVSCNYS